MDEKNCNIVKVRDDKTPIKYLMNGETGKFDIVGKVNYNWCNGPSFTKNELRTHI